MIIVFPSGNTNLWVQITRCLSSTIYWKATQATQKLEATLTEIFSVLPQVPSQKIRKLTFYLMWGEVSPKGGRKSGMSYIRPGEPKNYPYLDPSWKNVIVIYSAKNLMYLDALGSKKSLMHELAHAWHLNNWPENYEPIVSAYRNAKDLGLYRNVKDNKGKIIITSKQPHKHRYKITEDESKTAPNLLQRKFPVDGPNQVWCSDVTYIWAGTQWLYLAVVMDLFKRRIVVWSCSTSPDTNLTCATLRTAYESRGQPKNIMFHSDQGCHYTSIQLRSGLTLAPNVAEEKYWNEYKTVAK